MLLSIKEAYNKSMVTACCLVIPQDVIEIHCWEASAAVGNHDKDTFIYSNVLDDDTYINVYQEQGKRISISLLMKRLTNIILMVICRLFLSIKI